MTNSEWDPQPAQAAADAAVRRASQILLDRQDSHGWWSGRSAVDVTLAAEALLVAEVLGTRTGEITNAAAQQIRSLQQPDGGWTGIAESAADGDGPAAVGDLSASILAYLALRLAGDSADAYHMAVAAGCIRDAGGLAAAGVLARSWLALLGLTAWSDVPVPAPEVCYLPGRYAASGPATVALAVIGTLRPVRQLPFSVNELQAVDARKASAAERRPARRVPALSAAHRAALRGCGQWLIGWQHRSGLPPARRPAWPSSLVALHLLGYPLDHPVVASGLSWLAATVQPWPAAGSPRQAPVRRPPVRQPPVLETTLTVEALADSGFAPDHAGLVAAGRWLLLQRIEGPASGPGVATGVEPSGWSFGRAGYPVVTDTARVLVALSRVRLPGLTGKPAIGNAIRWLRSMQARDGSWSGSPAVTAHVVRALATHGSRDARALRRGVVWLLRQQQPAGSWPGPDGDGDLAVTAAVLRALIAAGVLPAKPPVKSAIGWLLRERNADFGWSWARGSAGSQAQPTACALAALLGAGGPAAATAIDMAVDWLAHAQQPDGGWRDEVVHASAAPRSGGRSSARGRGPLVPGLLLPLAALGRYVAAGDLAAADAIAPPGTDAVGASGLPVG
ncbi:MAG TPA: prenyltransferase/squalene oxidase repeat-containing protein [Streptosporangiaceae bacterium]|nr:prenyltransferase/squalene oxidase repeat-containing protein [Streptosporangiaceae bacterium]